MVKIYMKKNVWIIIALLIIAGLAIAYWPKQEDISSTPVETTTEITESMKQVVTLASQNNSGQQGNVDLEETDGKVKVMVKLNAVSPDVSQPVHIHEGTCANIGKIVYPLTALSSGSSETMLDVSLDELLAAMPLSINAHKSVEEIGEYVACGELSK